MARQGADGHATVGARTAELLVLSSGATGTSFASKDLASLCAMPSASPERRSTRKKANKMSDSEVGERLRSLEERGFDINVEVCQLSANPLVPCRPCSYDRGNVEVIFGDTTSTSLAIPADRTVNGPWQ